MSDWQSANEQDAVDTAQALGKELAATQKRLHEALDACTELAKANAGALITIDRLTRREAAIIDERNLVRIGNVTMVEAKPERLTDGYHTMAELYDHRRALTAVLAAIRSQQLGGGAWRSKLHHPDGDPIFPGYFIVGIMLPYGLITYHYELAHWDEFAHVPTLEHAPEWDGATAADTVTRLLAAARVL